MHAGVQSSLATQQTYGRLYGQVQQQASVLAYIDIVKIFAVAALLMMPLVFLMRRKSAGGRQPAGAPYPSLRTTGNAAISVAIAPLALAIVRLSF